MVQERLSACLLSDRPKRNDEDVQPSPLQMASTPQRQRFFRDPLSRGPGDVCALDRGRFIGAGAIQSSASAGAVWPRQTYVRAS